MAKGLTRGSSETENKDAGKEASNGRPEPEYSSNFHGDAAKVNADSSMVSQNATLTGRNASLASSSISSTQRESKTIVLSEQESDEEGIVLSPVVAGNANSNQEDGKSFFYDDESDEEEVRLPLVVALNCLEDCHLEAEALAGVAVVEHVSLAHVSQGKIEAAAAVLLHTLAYLPRAAQQCLHAWQLVLCLGSVDKGVDSAIANDLGLQLVHVDTSRADEVADTVMALMLGLLRHTHILGGHGFSSPAVIGTAQAAIRGMRRCRDLVLGIIGVSSSAYAVAARSVAFKMQVIYFDTDEERGTIVHRGFPAAVRRVASLKELLSLSDVISLHCRLTNDTVQIINAEALQHIKEGALLVNSSSCHLLDDSAVKQALVNGTISGFALDGAEGPQWAEAWLREMPNVLIMPRSADYSEEVWTEIRAKAVVVLRSFFIDNFIPQADLSEHEEWNSLSLEEKQDAFEKDSARDRDDDQQYADSQTSTDYKHKQMYLNSDKRGHPQEGGIALREGRSVYSKSGKKGRKRSGRRKQHIVSETFTVAEREANLSALERDDHATSVSGCDQMTNPSSRFASPVDVKCEREGGLSTMGSIHESLDSVGPIKSAVAGLAIDQLKDGLVIALRTAGEAGYYVARQRNPGRGWSLETRLDVTNRDPAAQFLFVLRHKERVGLRSLATGGKLLQANKKLELGFVNHTFDLFESWVLEGVTLQQCRFINSKIRRVKLDACIEIVAALQEDGVLRWIF